MSQRAATRVLQWADRPIRLSAPDRLSTIWNNPGQPSTPFNTGSRATRVTPRRASGSKFEPCTGHLLARVAAGTGADVDGPCAARGIRRRIPAPLARRGAGKLLNRLADLLEHDAERFVELLAREQGRPRWKCA